MLKKAQHAMEVSGTRGELDELSKDINKEYVKVAQRHKEIAERKIWLSVFIFAMLLAIALVNIKFRSINRETQ